MGTHMKTTIDISDALFDEAKKLARERSTTLREIVETALRRELAEAKAKPRRAFKLRDASVRGRGLQPGIDLSNREQILDLIYRRRG